MRRLRNRLLAAFLVTTLAPLTVTLWVTASLLERSLSLASTREIEDLSQALEKVGREYYQQGKEALRADVEAGKQQPARFFLDRRQSWPREILEFWESGESERFLAGGPSGSELHYFLRREDGVWRYVRRLGGLEMGKISALVGKSRARVELSRSRDLRRGFLFALLLVAVAAAVVAVAIMVLFAYRIAKPVQQLTDALRQVAAGQRQVRLASASRDELGEALLAFNHMAEQLENSEQRLILLTRLSSWQAVGRKMAHEMKNSLTPIRLTVEEMVSRYGERLAAEHRAEFDQAAQIIVDEVMRLERRVRAFSELAAEPPVHQSLLDLNQVVEERVSFLRAAHPEVIYRLQLSPERPRVQADQDLIRVVLTNLLENAAEAAGAGGVVLILTEQSGGRVAFEVHDSGPGLSRHARETLFQPTISFKKSGMGLGLSIAHKSALLSGGDLAFIDSQLSGAAFRFTLPAALSPVETQVATQGIKCAPSEL
ncbi:MAG: HAMP domain-containing histidine kinase [Bryobacteraceae bacterium]|nr:HAMP domain-containing histidine kinase [Bryobacteraceae bacterium]MDW8377886.1 HAMP domain-containing sensor histidine kinase [Bryobacterales bacterium]